MGTKSPFIRPRCIGTCRARTQMLINQSTIRIRPINNATKYFQIVRPWSFHSECEGMLIYTRSTLRSPMLISSASQDRGAKWWDRRSVRCCGLADGETGGPSVVTAVWQTVRQEVCPFLRLYGKRLDRRSVRCRGCMANGETGGSSVVAAVWQTVRQEVRPFFAAVWQTVRQEVRPLSRLYGKRWDRSSVLCRGCMANGETGGPSFVAAAWQTVRQEVRPLSRLHGKPVKSISHFLNKFRARLSKSCRTFSSLFYTPRIY